MIKEVNLRTLKKRRRGVSWKMSAVKSLGMGALVGIGVYKLVRNKNLMKNIRNLKLAGSQTSSAQELTLCINQCKDVIKDLESLTNNASGIVLKSTLDESAHQLKMCMNECEFALFQLS